MFTHVSSVQARRPESSRRLTHQVNMDLMATSTAMEVGVNGRKKASEVGVHPVPAKYRKSKK